MNGGCGFAGGGHASGYGAGGIHAVAGSGGPLSFGGGIYGHG
jgi:hypothetical protein